MPEPAQARIQRALETLVNSSHQESSLVIESGEVYLLFIASQKAGQLRMEAVTSDSLPPRLKLSAGRADELRKLGFDRGGNNRNWAREIELPPDDVADIAEQSTDILRRIYGAEEDVRVRLRHDDLERPDNESLVDAMRALAREENSATRHRMYTELVNANFMVPLIDEADDRHEISAADFRVLTVEDGFPIFVAFSDWQSLRYWKPRGCPYGVVHGSELFEALLERDAAALEINPSGDVGGQLYRHELELLDRAVQHHRRTRMN